MRRTGTLIIILIFLTAAFSSCSKDEAVNPSVSYSVKGRVYYAKDTSACLANVIVSSGGSSDTTDENGKFELSRLPGGRITLSFRYTDFKNLDTVIALNSNLDFSVGLSRERPDIFPNETGYYWKYLVADSTYTPRTDTALVRIISDGTFHDGRKAKIWQYDYWKYPGYKEPCGAFNNSFYVNNAVEYVFPLTVGQKWQDGLRTTEVKAIESVETPAGSIPNCYKLYQTESLENHYGYRIYWFSPRIGLVKQIYKIVDLSGNLNSTWILTDYKLE